MERRSRIQPINQIIKVQALVLVLTIVFFLLWQGFNGLIASGFGGLIGIANTFLQKWHLLRAAKYARADANLNLREAYQCMAERWALTIVMLTLGFVVFKLHGLGLLSGFVITQIALLFSNTNRA
jgi:ATP synthase protein I